MNLSVPTTNEQDKGTMEPQDEKTLRCFVEKNTSTDKSRKILTNMLLDQKTDMRRDINATAAHKAATTKAALPHESTHKAVRRKAITFQPLKGLPAIKTKAFIKKNAQKSGKKNAQKSGKKNRGVTTRRSTRKRPIREKQSSDLSGIIAINELHDQILNGGD